MNWLDITIIAVMGWSVWRGLKTGLVAGVARLLGVLAGLGAALCFYVPLAEYVDKRWQVSSYIQNWLPLSLPSHWPGKESEPLAVLDQLQKTFGLYGELLPRDSFSGSLQELGQSISRLLASGILELMSFIIIFLVISRLVYLAGELLAKLASMSFLGPADRLGGAAFGLARGILIILVMLVFLVSLQWPAALSTGGGNPYWLSRALENSRLARTFIKTAVFLDLDLPGFPRDSSFERVLSRLDKEPGQPEVFMKK